MNSGKGENDRDLFFGCSYIPLSHISYKHDLINHCGAFSTACIIWFNKRIIRGGKMNIVEIIDSGIVYRNPMPHIRSVQAYFPSVARLKNGDMVTAFSLGEAFESEDLHSFYSLSKDGGVTWQFCGGLFSALDDVPASDCCRISADADGRLVAFIIRHHRTRQDQGLANPENMGFVETDLMLMRSADEAVAWSSPEMITPPLAGPSFELCSPVVFLSDDRWIIPTSTWKGWDGHCPNGMKMVGLVSADRGQSWDTYIDIMADPEGKIIYWESKLIQLQDKSLLAVAWAFDTENNCDLPNHYAVSSDNARSFTPPVSTGLYGQTLACIQLDDGQILSVYRRIDKKGLWANISRIASGKWINTGQYPLWGYDQENLTGSDKNIIRNFNVLRFGAPNIINTGDDTAYIVFWCVEDCVSNIRWIKIKVNRQETGKC